MAGHSKWSQIKRQKGVTDQKRGAIFSKMARLISLAAKNGTDPANNFQLRIALEQARSVNLPKENIKRAIERATTTETAQYEYFILEAYGTNGVAFLIEVATDNRHRAVSDVRSQLNKYGGKLSETGSVSYLFRQRGLLTFSLPDSVEDFELTLIESGAEEFSNDQNEYFVYTNPKDLSQVKKTLEEHNYHSTTTDLIFDPLTTIKINQNENERLLKLLDGLENLDDVTTVYSNLEITE